MTASTSLSVLQCGDPSGTGGGGPGYTYADETQPDMVYPAGTLAMANAGPDTNGSQFFLVYEDSALPPDYTVFGTVTQGLDVLQGIAAKGISGGGTDGAPVEPVTISGVTVTD
jgi:peptidyl-prolyl cis-trans isomerase B (cyclophilin B)